MRARGARPGPQDVQRRCQTTFFVQHELRHNRLELVLVLVYGSHMASMPLLTMCREQKAVIIMSSPRVWYGNAVWYVMTSQDFHPADHERLAVTGLPIGNRLV